MRGNKRGCIVNRNGNLSIKLSLGKGPDGKYKYQWISLGKVKMTEAKTRLTELLHKMDTGSYTVQGKVTVSEYLTRWLEDYAKVNLSPRGFERYAGIINKYFIPEFGNIALVKLKPEHLQRHYTGLIAAGLNINTARYHHAVIHKALQVALKWQLVSRNVADAINPGRVRREEMQTWNEIELNAFLDTARDSQYYALFYTALFTGMRRSELLALRWQDIDFIFSQLYVNRSLHHLKDGSYVYTQPKSARSRRTIALPASLALVLQKYREERERDAEMCGLTINGSDLAFGALDGCPLRPNTITRAWQNLAIKAGVKVIRLHDARHTHATLMLKQGIHPKIVQERLGHASIQMTLDIYSHVSPGLQQAAAESFDKLVVEDNIYRKI